MKHIITITLLLAALATQTWGQPYETNCTDRFSPRTPTSLENLLDRTADRNGDEQVRLRPFQRIPAEARCVREQGGVETKYALVDLGVDGAKQFALDEGDSSSTSRYIRWSRFSGRVGSDYHLVFSSQEAELERENLRNAYPTLLPDRWGKLREAASMGHAFPCARYFVLYKLDYRAEDDEPKLWFSGSILIIGTENQQHYGRYENRWEHEYRVSGFGSDPTSGRTFLPVWVDFNFGADTGCY